MALLGARLDVHTHDGYHHTRDACFQLLVINTLLFVAMRCMPHLVQATPPIQLLVLIRHRQVLERLL